MFILQVWIISEEITRVWSPLQPFRFVSPLSSKMRGFPVSEELYGKHLRADHSCTRVKSHCLTWPCKHSQPFHSSCNGRLTKKTKKQKTSDWALMWCLKCQNWGQSKKNTSFSNPTGSSSEHKGRHYGVLCVGVCVCETQGCVSRHTMPAFIQLLGSRPFGPLHTQEKCKIYLFMLKSIWWWRNGSLRTKAVT